MPSSGVDVAIVGAGPYGLSLAAHLKDKRIRFRIFGQPMRTWLDMPRGMYLKSQGLATNVYTPDGRLGFVAYCQERGLEPNDPFAIADFARYGVWAQKQLLPELEQVDVANVSRAGDGFELTLANGQALRAERVVLAVGITHFAHMPPAIINLPSALASHTSQHRDYNVFVDKEVCVVGAGQSAFEAVRLLSQAGARPRLVVRGPRIEFAEKSSSRRSLWQRIRRPLNGLALGYKGWVLVNLPLLAHFAPARWRVPFVKSYLRPLGASWLRDHIVGKVPVLTNCTLVRAVPQAGRVSLWVSQKGKGERQILCDHVVAGTGYEVDVDRLGFLDVHLRRSIRRIGRSPALDVRFQASVPGIYFIGLASSFSFGPMFRFVVGADYTSRALAREFARLSKLPHIRNAQSVEQVRAMESPSRGTHG